MHRSQRRAAMWMAVASFSLLVFPVRAQPSMVAKGLEARLYAPCCYRGTLDEHSSELASELRKEIEIRLAAGETERAIEADFVARYGTKVVAVHGKALGAVGIGASIGMLVAGFALVLAVRRSGRRTRQDPPGTLPSTLEETVEARAAYEARLDSELERTEP